MNKYPDGVRVVKSELDGRFLIATDIMRNDMFYRILIAIDPDGMIRIFRLRIDPDDNTSGHLLVTGVADEVIEWYVPSRALIEKFSVNEYPLGLMFHLVEGWPDIPSEVVWGMLDAEREDDIDDGLADQLRDLLGGNDGKDD